MKRQFIYLLSVLFLAISCNKNMDEDSLNPPKGPETGKKEDVIGLSDRKVNFTSKKDTVQIQTTGSDWWFDIIMIDNTKYEITPENNTNQLEKHEFHQVCNWLTINRKANKIILIAAPNITNEQRTFELSLKAENYSDSIKGTQAIRLEGDWDDCIGLSQKDVKFNWEGGTATIHTQYNWWWFSTIEVDGIQTIIGSEGGAQIEEGKEFYKKCDWLTVHASYKKIELTVEPNYNETRNFKISLQAGDYFDLIEGIQEHSIAGKWDDCIGLSKKKVEFTTEGGKITIDTQDHRWWLNAIEVDGNRTNIGKEGSAQIDRKEFFKQCDWLSVHTSYKKIELTAEPNATGKKRIFKIYLQAGNYFDNIEGTQTK